MKAHPIHTEYLISEDGRVFSTKRNKYLTPRVNDRGYVKVKVNGKVRALHRLVAQTYIPNHMNKPQVNHKNGDKTDNRVVNLEWSTGSENMIHARDNGLLNPRSGENHYKAILTDRQVQDVLYLRHELKEKVSKIAQHFGVSESCIRQIIYGTRR